MSAFLGEGIPMKTRKQPLFFLLAAVMVLIAGMTVHSGCKSSRGRIKHTAENDTIGSHKAGSAVFNPLINSAVAQLLAREQEQMVQPVVYQQQEMHGGVETIPPGLGCKRICFVGVENKSIEELGDFKDHIYQTIDSQILQSEAFQPVSFRAIQAGLRETGLRADDLFLPNHRARFAQVMGQMGESFDYLLFATITSGTTRENRDMQRDYLLTLELVDLRSGRSIKESAELRKEYNRSFMGKLKTMMQ
jgi:hypothetical protein